MTQQSGKRILIIDDDQQRAAAMERALSGDGFAVLRAADSLDGLIAVEEQRPDALILSWSMPFISGSILLYALQKGLETPPPVIALTATPEERRVALLMGVHAALDVPPNVVLLQHLVRDALGYTKTT